MPDTNKQSRQNGWSGLPRSEMNWQQKMANDTNGVVTIPNVGITPLGFGISMWGVLDAAQGEYLKGGALFLLGSTADLIDGRWARKYGVSSPLGEKLDAGLDKVRILAALTALTFSGVISPYESIPIATTQVGIAAVSAIGNKRGRVMHAEGPGKIALFIASGVVVCDAAAEAVNQVSDRTMIGLTQSLEIGGAALTVTTVAYGAKTIYDYSRQAFGHPPSPTELPNTLE